MASFAKRWRPRHLLAAWSAYWLGLLVVTLGDPLLRIWQLTRGPEGRGSISANFGDGALKLTVVEQGRTIWEGATDPTTLTLWLVLPPLLLWGMWLLLRGRAPKPDPLPSPAAPRALDAGAPGWSSPAPADSDPMRVRRDPP